MAERPPINPFANLKADPTLARMAASSGDNLARMRQGLATQQLTNRGAMNRTNADNLARMHRLGITNEIPSLLRSAGKISPEVLKTMIRRGNIRELKDTMPIVKQGAEIGKYLPSLKNESLIDAGNIFRTDLTPGPTLGERKSKAGLKTTGTTELQTTKYAPDASGNFQKEVKKVGSKVESKGDTKQNQALYKKITADVIDKLGLKDPVVISHESGKHAVIEHTVGRNRVRSTVNYNKKKP
jgi:hypothetical protein